MLLFFFFFFSSSSSYFNTLAHISNEHGSEAHVFFSALLLCVNYSARIEDLFFFFCISSRVFYTCIHIQLFFFLFHAVFFFFFRNLKNLFELFIRPFLYVFFWFVIIIIIIFCSDLFSFSLPCLFDFFSMKYEESQRSKRLIPRKKAFPLVSLPIKD